MSVCGRVETSQTHCSGWLDIHFCMPWEPEQPCTLSSTHAWACSSTLQLLTECPRTASRQKLEDFWGKIALISTSKNCIWVSWNPGWGLWPPVCSSCSLKRVWLWLLGSTVPRAAVPSCVRAELQGFSVENTGIKYFVMASYCCGIAFCNHLNVA